MVIDDITHALEVLRPVFDTSSGKDGFVSVELAPGLARDTDASVAAAAALHERIDAPTRTSRSQPPRKGYRRSGGWLVRAATSTSPSSLGPPATSK